MSVMTVLSNKLIHGASDPPATSVAVGKTTLAFLWWEPRSTNVTVISDIGLYYSR